MPFFTIIIPTYNRANLLVGTLQSVKNQTFTDWECIIIDDGSTDNTKEVINVECAKDKRVRYIYQKNAERSAARNNGIKYATGQYICFLDSDDKYKDNHLKTLYDAITDEKFPVALFFTNYEVLRDGKYSTVNVPALITHPTEYFLINAVIPARVCIHNEILKTEKFDEDIVIVEDTILWVCIAQKFQIFQVRKNTVVYNLHEDNSINIKNNSSLKRMKGLRLFFKRYPLIKEKIAISLRKTLIGDTYFGMAKHYIYKKQKWCAFRYLLLSIIYLGNHAQLKHKLYLIMLLVKNKQIPEYQ